MSTRRRRNSVNRGDPPVSLAVEIARRFTANFALIVGVVVGGILGGAWFGFPGLGAGLVLMGGIGHVLDRIARHQDPRSLTTRLPLFFGGLGLFAVAALLAASVFFNDDDGNAGDDAFRQVLATMVLQIDDVPQGMQSLGGSFSTNADAASGLGGGPTEEQLDAWGRILGHKNDFQATEPAIVSAITAISTSVSIYETAQGTSDSFTDRVTSARAVDWATSHSDLTEFEQEEIERDLGVDDMLWLHFTGYKEIGAGDRRLISDDQIVFRVDRAWGFIGAISTAAAGVEDRAFMLQPLEVLARTQAQHMRDGLKSDALE